jgi:hypothetical protein
MKLGAAAKNWTDRAMRRKTFRILGVLPKKAVKWYQIHRSTEMSVAYADLARAKMHRGIR